MLSLLLLLHRHQRDGEARELRKVREGRRQRDGEELRKGELGWVHVVVRSADHQEARGPKGFLNMSLTPWSPMTSTEGGDRWTPTEHWAKWLCADADVTWQ